MELKRKLFVTKDELSARQMKEHLSDEFYVIGKSSALCGRSFDLIIIACDIDEGNLMRITNRMSPECDVIYTC